MTERCVMVEVAVLAAALGCFFAMLARMGLPRLRLPVMCHPSFHRASIDRYFVSVRTWRSDREAPEMVQLLERLGAREIPYAVALAILALLPSCRKPMWDCTPFGAGRRCIELDSSPLPETFACYETSGREICTSTSAPRLPARFACRRAGADTVCHRAVTRYPDDGGARAWRCLRDESGRRTCAPRDLGNDPWECDALGVCRRYFPDYPDDGEWECYDTGGRQICRSQKTHLTSPQWTCADHGKYRICVDPDPDAPGPGYRCQFEAERHARRCRPDPKPPSCRNEEDCGRGICEAGTCLRPLLAECFWDNDCDGAKCGGGTCGKR